MLALDIDGTLVASDGRMPDKVGERLQKLHQRLRIVLASGRRFWLISHLHDALALRPDAVVALNGAFAVDADGQLQFAERLGARLVRVLFAGARREGLQPGLCLPHSDGPDLRGDVPPYRPTQAGYGGPATAADVRDAVYVRAVGPMQAALRYSAVAHRLLGIAVHGGVFPLAETDLFAAEFFPGWVNKATAVARLAEQWGIRPQEVVAVGDGGNDVEMLRWAGLGVAMGNAEEAARRAASRVIGHVDEGGLADFLQEMLQRTA